MTDTLALEKLYADVRTQFALDGTVCDQPFGWRAAAEQSIAPCIVWIPGDDKTGELGSVDPPRNPGRNPRSLATLRELFTCLISAQDPADPENEAAQYKATRLLFDAWYRAIALRAFGTFAIERSEWIKVGIRTQRRFGAGIRVVASVQAVIPDVVLQGVPVDADAVVSLSELNVTETQTISAAPAADASEAP